MSPFYSFPPYLVADHPSRGINRSASISTASQPKSISVGEDGTVFVAEINGLEAIRDNQKVFELKLSYSPNAVAAGKGIVAVGGEVRLFHHQHFI